MVTYAGFITKYKQFESLDGATYAAFLPDVLAEINRVPTWGDLKDRATELLLGHVISIADPDDQSSKNVSEVEVEDRRYRVAFQDAMGDLSGTWFGVEYERLLKLVSGQGAVATSSKRGNSFVGQRTLPIKLEW
jgi:Protein of unknown function (DUF4054)